MPYYAIMPSASFLLQRFFPPFTSPPKGQAEAQVIVLFCQ